MLEAPGDALGEHGLAGAGLALDEQRAAELDGDVDRLHEVGRGDVVAGARVARGGGDVTRGGVGTRGGVRTRGGVAAGRRGSGLRGKPAAHELCDSLSSAGRDRA